ncbi:MAG: hypothetical protein IT463_04735, partial [Planctomycetes bacterium]|nr:hypothetical protein [Planctomycetota bacterium]
QNADYERDRLAGLLQQAAERLQAENAEDLRLQALEPPRQSPEDVLPEISAMRRANELRLLPGHGK